MNKFRLYFTVLTSSLLLLASCNSRDLDLGLQPEADPSQQPVAVTFNFDQGDLGATADPESVSEPATRAGTNTPLRPGETIRLVVYRSGAGLSPANFVTERSYIVEAGSPNKLSPCTVDDNGLINGGAEDIFLIPTLEYDIYAYSPARAITDHKTVAGVQHGDDFLASKTTITLAKFTKTVTLTALDHKCSLLELNIISDSQDNTVATLVGKRITFKQISKSPASYTLGDAAVTAAAGTEDVKMESFEKVSDLAFNASRIVLPMAEGTFDIEFIVLINGAEYNLKSTVQDLAFEANKHYKWNVTCKRQGVVLSFSVQSWGSASQTVETGVPAPIQHPANTYMVQPGLGVSFEMQHPDGTAIANAGSIAKAQVLWQTKDGANLVIGSAQNVEWDNSKKRILVYTNSAATGGGRAVVVARDAADNIVYSWLIWVTGYDPSKALNGANKTANQELIAKVVGGAVHVYDAAGFQTTNGQQSVMMDRNLGSTSVMNAGCYYQNGRKDPFAADGEPLFTADGSAYTQTISGSDATLAEATANPSVMYSQYTGASPWKQFTASVKKSNDDPCPKGWRVPYLDAANGTWNAFTGTTFTATAGGRQYTGTPAAYPWAGYYAGGAFTGSEGRYWGAGRDGATGYCLSFNGGSVTGASTEAVASALSIRCVQDAEQYPYKTPTMDQVTISLVTNNSAQLNGLMSSSADAIITAYGFWYGTDPAAANGSGTHVVATNMGVDGKFSASATALTQGTTYYAQGYITTSDNLTVYTTPRVAFTPSGSPAVNTVEATALSHSSGRVKSEVTNTGGSAVERGILYSATKDFNPATQGTKVVAPGNGTGEYTLDISGLEQSTTYYVRAYVINSLSSSYGMQRSFTTSGAAKFNQPRVSDIAATSAKFACYMTGPAAPAVTEWGYQWSTSSEFPADATTVSVTASGPYAIGEMPTHTATGLTAGGLYFMRAYAINAAGKGYSPITRFTALDLPKVVITLATTGTNKFDFNGKVTATVSNKIESTGSNPITACGIEWSANPTFAGGTGTRIASTPPTGSDFNVLHVIESDTDYYYRAYATSLAGTGYSDIVNLRLNYIAPDMNGINLTVIDRMLGALTIRPNKWATLGNARSYYGYESVPTSAGATESLNVGESPSLDNTESRLMVNTTYTIRQFVEDFKGRYYSDGSTTGTTLSNYCTIDKNGTNGGGGPIEIVAGLDEQWPTIWSTEYGEIGLPKSADGYVLTKALVEDKSSGTRLFRAAGDCWDLPYDRSRWYLESRYRLPLLIKELHNHPERYNGRFNFKSGVKYWTSSESSFTGAWTINSNGDGDTELKKDNHVVRCFRQRTLPADLYPPSGEELKK